MWPLPTKPREKQLEVFNDSKDQLSWAYFLEMGVGKTLIGLAVACYLYLLGKIDLLVVVAPKGVYLNWPRREIVKHWPLDVPRREWVWPKLKPPRGDTGLEMVFINVEALSSSKKAVDYIFDKVKGRKAMLIVDESSGCKNSKSNRSKVLHNLGKVCLYKRIMTGSPVTQAPLDLFSQLKILWLDVGLWPYQSFMHFKNRFAITQQVRFGMRSFNQIVGYKGLDELQDRMKRFSSRVLKSECLDLPEKIYLTREVELTDEQDKAYRDMAEQGFHELSELEIVTATHAMVALQKLQQICCGHMTDPESGVVHQFKHRRLDALLEVVDELQGQVVIWSSWRQSLREIVAELKKVYGDDQVCEYWGDTSAEAREVGLSEFIDGKRRFFVGNPKTGGYGLTLTNASNMVYYNNSFSLEERLQSEDRCHRFGQTKAVTYVDLVATGTVDEDVLDALFNKQELASKTLGDEFLGWFRRARQKG